MSFKCCKGCVPPKRHIGCHGKCEEYLEEKRDYELWKARVNAYKDENLMPKVKNPVQKPKRSW